LAIVYFCPLAKLFSRITTGAAGVGGGTDVAPSIQIGETIRSDQTRYAHQILTQYRSAEIGLLNGQCDFFFDLSDLQSSQLSMISTIGGIRNRFSPIGLVVFFLVKLDVFLAHSS
jgi:hypothetical protein